MLEKNGIHTHFVKELNDRETLVKKVEIVPLEVIVRNVGAGSFAKRMGIEEGRTLKCPTVEFSYKNDALGDPFINHWYALALNLATEEEIEKITETAFAVNEVLRNFFAAAGIELIDFKLEFGRFDGKILLADEISPDTCRALSEGKVQQLPVKQHRTKTTNRYFNYIYVRMGVHTLIHKRTEDDIWKNLFELPLVETEKDLSEEEFLACPQFHALFAEGEVRMVRILLRGVKHVLSHRVIYTNFYEVTLPDNSSSFSSYQRVAVEDLGRYAVPRLIHAFLEKYV